VFIEPGYVWAATVRGAARMEATRRPALFTSPASWPAIDVLSTLPSCGWKINGLHRGRSVIFELVAHSMLNSLVGQLRSLDPRTLESPLVGFYSAYEFVITCGNSISCVKPVMAPLSPITASARASAMQRLPPFVLRCQQSELSHQAVRRCPRQSARKAMRQRSDEGSRRRRQQQRVFSERLALVKA
jgi:hypothetical protein